MSEFLHARCLQATPLLRITDFACRAPASGCGGEEQASSHHLLFTRTGVFVKHTGRRQLVAEPTHALFFNAGESFRVSHPVNGGDECTMVSCAASTWLELLRRYDATVIERPTAPFTVPYAPLSAHALLGSRQLRSAARRRTTDVLQVEENALDLLDAVLRDAYAMRPVTAPVSRTRTTSARRDLAESTKLAIATDPASNRSLGELARCIGSSPFHLAHVFREQIGIPIHQFRLRLRLTLALERLADGSGEETLSALALALGFSSHSHFTTLFRRVFGVAPSTFRRSTSRRRSELRKNLQA